MNIKSIILSLGLLLSPALLVGCGGGSSDPVVETSDVPVVLTPDVKVRTYSLEQADNIVFVFDEASQQDMLDKAHVTAIDRDRKSVV